MMMSSMLGFRFDQRMMDELSKGIQGSPPFTLLTIRLYVRNPEEEMRFFTGLLGVTPRMENPHIVMLPLATGIMLTLQEAMDDKGSKIEKIVPYAGQVEFDLETKNIQCVWDNAQRLSTRYLCQMISGRNFSLFKIQSPNGAVFCFWQKKTQVAEE